MPSTVFVEVAIGFRIGFAVGRAFRRKETADLSFSRGGIMTSIRKQQEDDARVCAICLDGDVQDDNQILFCDRCDVAVHQACYSVETIPTGDWFCQACAMGFNPSTLTCVLCSHFGGAYKRTIDNRWTHSICYIFIPDVYVADTSNGDFEIILEDMNPKRMKMKCSLCLKKDGACIQCSASRCAVPAHPWCILHIPNGCRHRLVEDNDTKALIPEFYCKNHAFAVQEEESPNLPLKRSSSPDDSDFVLKKQRSTSSKGLSSSFPNVVANSGNSIMKSKRSPLRNAILNNQIISFGSPLQAKIARGKDKKELVNPKIVSSSSSSLRSFGEEDVHDSPALLNCSLYDCSISINGSHRAVALSKCELHRCEVLVSGSLDSGTEPSDPPMIGCMFHDCKIKTASSLGFCILDSCTFHSSTIESGSDGSSSELQQRQQPRPQPKRKEQYQVTVPADVRAGQSFSAMINNKEVLVTCPPHARPGNRVTFYLETENAAETSESQTFEVMVPSNVKPGDSFELIANGRLVTVSCPLDVKPGDKVRFQLAKSCSVSDVRDSPLAATTADESTLENKGAQKAFVQPNGTLWSAGYFESVVKSDVNRERKSGDDDSDENEEDVMAWKPNSF